MTSPAKHYYTVSRLEKPKKHPYRKYWEHYHRLFDTEIQECPAHSTIHELNLKLEEGRRELESFYFPENKLVVDEDNWSVIRLADGLEIAFHLRWL